MASKRKIVFNQERAKQKKVFRTPTAPATEWHKDKAKYNRKEKHRGDYA